MHHLVHEMLSIAYTASTLSKDAIYKNLTDGALLIKEPWENTRIKMQGDPDNHKNLIICPLAHFHPALKI